MTEVSSGWREDLNSAQSSPPAKCEAPLVGNRTDGDLRAGRQVDTADTLSSVAPCRVKS